MRSASAAWILANTTRIRVGTAIMQIGARTPANTAMTAMTLAHLSGNRFLVGLGASGPQVIEGWHGVPYSKPVTSMREYIRILRLIMAREAPVEFDGEIYQLPYRGPGSTGLGKPLKSILRGDPGHPDLRRELHPGRARRRGGSCRRGVPDLDRAGQGAAHRGSPGARTSRDAPTGARAPTSTSRRR